MLMNLTRMRRANWTATVQSNYVLYKSGLQLPDQDLLNAVFGRDPGRIPNRSVIGQHLVPDNVSFRNPFDSRSVLFCRRTATAALQVQLPHPRLPMQSHRESSWSLRQCLQGWSENSARKQSDILFRRSHVLAVLFQGVSKGNICFVVLFAPVYCTLTSACLPPPFSSVRNEITTSFSDLCTRCTRQSAV